MSLVKMECMEQYLFPTVLISFTETRLNLPSIRRVTLVKCDLYKNISVYEKEMISDRFRMAANSPTPHTHTQTFHLGACVTTFASKSPHYTRFVRIKTLMLYVSA